MNLLKIIVNKKRKKKKEMEKQKKVFNLIQETKKNEISFFLLFYLCCCFSLYVMHRTVIIRHMHVNMLLLFKKHIFFLRSWKIRMIDVCRYSLGNDRKQLFTNIFFLVFTFQGFNFVLTLFFGVHSFFCFFNCFLMEIYT